MLLKRREANEVCNKFILNHSNILLLKSGNIKNNFQNTVVLYGG